MTDIRTLGIVGSGQMGGGIGQVAAQAGFSVLLYDVTLEIINRAHGTTSLADLGKADLVIEAAPEDYEIKKAIFQQLDQLTRPEVILASNTSSISLTQLGAVTQRPDKVIGMHFMNPPAVMQLVEIVRGLVTSDETLQVVDALAKKMGKTTIQAKDYAGFIVNRILLPMINEAIYALYEGVGGVEDIDQGMKLGTNQPMGPLALADLIGLDTCLAVLERLHHGLGDDKYRPCPEPPLVVVVATLVTRRAAGTTAVVTTNPRTR